MRILVPLVVGVVSGVATIEYGLPVFAVAVATLLGIGITRALFRQHAEHD